MDKLIMPVICECGFSTMDARKAYNHAMEHQRDDAQLDDLKSMRYKRYYPTKEIKEKRK